MANMFKEPVSNAELSLSTISEYILLPCTDRVLAKFKIENWIHCLERQGKKKKIYVGMNRYT